eukprot:TRINITY_DN1598_c0_g1_i6.p1 TRINITY_DN1598_c0_g1~~TRINITY_DN1598_c0_g1_i6.p1  ORF type:complete len:396 (-),score=82.04 TRINITY_DN1598_c0_g1_i6:537-1604(-)
MARPRRSLAAALVAAAAVAATAAAARLPRRSSGALATVSAVRAFGEKDVTGTYTFFKDFGVNGAYACPQTVAFTANPVADPGRSVFSVPHNTIAHDGVACAGKASLDVLPSSVLTKGDLMDGLGLTAMTELADSIVDSLFKNTGGFLLGIEPKGRTCGASGLPGGSAVLFVHEERSVRLLDNLVLPGGGGVSYMGMVVPDKACIYVRGPGDRPPGVTVGGGETTNRRATGTLTALRPCRRRRRRPRARRRPLQTTAASPPRRRCGSPTGRSRPWPTWPLATPSTSAGAPTRTCTRGRTASPTATPRMWPLRRRRGRRPRRPSSSPPPTMCMWGGPWRQRRRCGRGTSLPTRRGRP